MSDVTLESLLADFEEKKIPVVAMYRRTWYPTENYASWINFTPDEWVEKPEITKKRVKPEFSGITAEIDEKSFYNIKNMVDASIDAARRYIVARDFNEFREDKWRVLASGENQP